MPHPASKLLSGIQSPSSVRLGPLTQQLLNGARWSGADLFPAWQGWADDVEQVLDFLRREGRLAAFLNIAKKASTPQHRDSCLAEARAAFCLAGKGFRVVQWEPPGEGTTKGEALVSLDGGPEIFVEVKQPGWQGEYIPRRIADRKVLSAASLARTKMEKYRDADAEFVAPQTVAMDVVRRNILPKLTDKLPNLGVVVDDLRVSPLRLHRLADFVQREFEKPDRDPDDPYDVFTYERLGGLLFLHPESDDSDLVYYYSAFVSNPRVLQPCALPASVASVFYNMREESRRRMEQHHIGPAYY